MGSLQDPEDPLHLSYNKSRSQVSVRVSPLSNMATEQRLRFFGHIARSASDEDHYCAVAAAIRKPPSDRKRPRGRPYHMWLRATESDRRLQNIGPLENTAGLIVDTAMLKQMTPRSDNLIS